MPPGHVLFEEDGVAYGEGDFVACNPSPGVGSLPYIGLLVREAGESPLALAEGEKAIVLQWMFRQQDLANGIDLLSEEKKLSVRLLSACKELFFSEQCDEVASSSVLRKVSVVFACNDVNDGGAGLKDDEFLIRFSVDLETGSLSTLSSLQSRDVQAQLGRLVRDFPYVATSPSPAQAETSTSQQLAARGHRMGDEALREQAGAGKTGKEAQGTRTGQAARGKAIQEAAERREGGEGSRDDVGGAQGEDGARRGGDVASQWCVEGSAGQGAACNEHHESGESSIRSMQNQHDSRIGQGETCNEATVEAGCSLQMCTAHHSAKAPQEQTVEETGGGGEEPELDVNASGVEDRRLVRGEGVSGRREEEVAVQGLLQPCICNSGKTFGDCHYKEAIKASAAKTQETFKGGSRSPKQDYCEPVPASRGTPETDTPDRERPGAQKTSVVQTQPGRAEHAMNQEAISVEERGEGPKDTGPREAQGEAHGVGTEATADGIGAITPTQPQEADSQDKEIVDEKMSQASRESELAAGEVKSLALHDPALAGDGRDCSHHRTLVASPSPQVAGKQLARQGHHAEEGVSIAAAERRERDRGEEKTGRGLTMVRTDKAKDGAADEQVKVVGSPQNSNSKHTSNPMPNDILVSEASGLVQSLPFKVSNRVGGTEMTDKAKDDASTVKTAPDRLTVKTIDFRVGDKVMAMREKVGRNALSDEEREGMVSEGPNIVSCAEMLCCKTTGSEHIGCLIGKRFSGKMYLGQCIAWLPAGSAENHYGILVGQDEYKVIFHDNDVHLLSHVDLLECKKNVKSSLTTARNLKALKGYVEVWQQTYDRVVEQAVAECSGKVDNQQQEAQFFPATIREVKGDGFFFVSWDDGYGLDRTKCAFELQRPQFREGKTCLGGQEKVQRSPKEAVSVQPPAPAAGHTERTAKDGFQQQHGKREEQDVMVQGDAESHEMGEARQEYDVGTRVRMLFDDDVWYDGKVTKYNSRRGKYVIAFDDGDVQESSIPGKDIEIIGPEETDSVQKTKPTAQPYIGQMLFMHWPKIGWFTGSIHKITMTKRYRAFFCDGDEVMLTRVQVLHGNREYQEAFGPNQKGKRPPACGCGRADCRRFFDASGHFDCESDHDEERMAVDMDHVEKGEGQNTDEREEEKGTQDQSGPETSPEVDLNGIQTEQDNHDVNQKEAETEMNKRDQLEGLSASGSRGNDDVVHDTLLLQQQERKEKGKSESDGFAKTNRELAKNKNSAEVDETNHIEGNEKATGKKQKRLHELQAVSKDFMRQGIVDEEEVAHPSSSRRKTNLTVQLKEFDKRRKIQAMQEHRVEQKTNANFANGSEVLFRRVQIYWSYEKKWYDGVVDKFNPKTGKHHVSYDDGDKLWYDFSKESSIVRWMDEPPKQDGDAAPSKARGSKVGHETGSDSATSGDDVGVRPDLATTTANCTHSDSTRSDDVLRSDDGPAAEEGGGDGIQPLSKKERRARKRLRIGSCPDSDEDEPEGFKKKDGKKKNGRRHTRDRKSSPPNSEKEKGGDSAFVEVSSSGDEGEGLGANYFLDGPAEAIKQAACPLFLREDVTSRVIALQTDVNSRMCPDGNPDYTSCVDLMGPERHVSDFCRVMDGPLFADAKQRAAEAAKRHEFFLAPYLGHGFYNSHGRFFTQMRIMRHVCEFLSREQLVLPTDHFLDFSAGANEFAPMLAKETSCSFQSFDIFPAKNSTNFKLKNWFDVSKKDVSTDGAGRAVVLGFNPPFGKDNIEARKFVVHGIKTFRPRLLVLVVPDLEDARVGKLRELAEYEVCHVDERLCESASSMGEKHSTGTRPKFIVYSRISSTSSASAAPNRGPWRRDVPSEPPHSAQQCLPGLPRSRSPAAAFPRTHAPGSSGGRDFSRY